MAYDPYKTFSAGSVTANLIAAQTALEAASISALNLDTHVEAGGLYREIRAARDAIEALRKRDLWEDCRQVLDSTAARP